MIGEHEIIIKLPYGCRMAVERQEQERKKKQYQAFYSLLVLLVDHGRKTGGIELQ